MQIKNASAEGAAERVAFEWDTLFAEGAADCDNSLGAGISVLSRLQRCSLFLSLPRPRRLSLEAKIFQRFAP